MKRNLKDYLIIALKGMGMGAADVVPGVSGGTIAFVVGIYEELIESIRSVNVGSLKLLLSLKLKKFWAAVNGSFLLSLVAGIAASFLLLAKTMTWLLQNERVLTYAFFFGLILASTYYVSKRIAQWGWSSIAAFVLGSVVAVCVTMVSPAQTPNDLWFIFLCGVVAICAMILPGISGSFILLLFSKYEYIMSALAELKMSVILTFMCGAAIGITSFSHLLSWLFRRYHDVTVALLTGFMLGSLNKIWPWKEALSEKNMLPNEHAIPAAALMLLGCAVIAVVEMASSRKEQKAQG